MPSSRPYAPPRPLAASEAGIMGNNYLYEKDFDDLLPFLLQIKP